MEIQEQFNELTGLISTFKAEAEKEMKSLGAINQSTAEKLTAFQTQLDALDKKMAERHAQTQPGETLREYLEKSEDVQRCMKDHRGMFEIPGKFMPELERKTTITSSAVGAQTTGVLQIERIPGITPEARQVLRVRDVLTANPTTMQVIDFVKVANTMSQGSPQTEGSDKGENAMTFAAVSAVVRTIASWIPATKQILDDFGELMSFLNTTLTYYVNLGEEKQLLSGDGTGTNLSGLITQATAFNTSLLVAAAGWNKIDIVGRAAQQIMAAKELEPTFVILHPTDWWGMRLQKDSYGRYILGDPQTPLVQQALFGLTPVITTSIASGTFLVGSGSPIASEIRDRMGITVEVGTQHSDYFTKNLVAIRAEKRLAFLTRRPASYITGTFTTSP